MGQALRVADFYNDIAIKFSSWQQVLRNARSPVPWEKVTVIILDILIRETFSLT